MGVSFQPIIRKTVALSVGLLLLCGTSLASDYGDWVSGIKALTDGEHQCTAFRVNVAPWVSAGHCNFDPAKLGEWTVKQVKLSKDPDLSLYQVDPEDIGPGFVFKFAAKDPEVGDEAVIVGYFAGAKDPITFFGRIMGGHYEDLKAKRYVQAMGAPGGSGSPVLVNGKVVSVLTGGANLSGGDVPIGAIFTYGPDLAQIREFLK